MALFIAYVLSVYLARVLGEIAGLLAVRSLVRTGIGLIQRVALDGGAHLAREPCTAFEHIIGQGDIVLLGHVTLEEYLLQVGAGFEHIRGLEDSRGEDIAEVKRRQALATVEHALHVGHFLGVEVAEVEGLQG